MWVIPVESEQKESGHFTLTPYDESFYYLTTRDYKPPNKHTFTATLKPYDKSFYYHTTCKPTNEDTSKVEIHEEEKGKAI